LVDELEKKTLSADSFGKKTKTKQTPPDQKFRVFQHLQQSISSHVQHHDPPRTTQTGI
jgi:hypothetical protein